MTINHQGQQPAVTIAFNLAPGVSLGHAVGKTTEIWSTKRRSSGDHRDGLPGTAQVFQDSLRGQGVLILAAVFAAFVILGILYESFIHPITIISGLPSAGIGAILTLMLFSMDLSVIAMIGIVMLVGIVKKNAIMMIDFAMERRRGLQRGARDSRGRGVAVPSDHDDDLRSDFRHAADRARHGRRRRTASAARRCGGRRAVRVAAVDAVHHAGDLYLSRSHRPPPEAPPRTAADEVEEAPPAIAAE